MGCTVTVWYCFCCSCCKYCCCCWHDSCIAINAAVDFAISVVAHDDTTVAVVTVVVDDDVAATVIHVVADATYVSVIAVDFGVAISACCCLMQPAVWDIAEATAAKTLLQKQRYFYLYFCKVIRLFRIQHNVEEY